VKTFENFFHTKSIQVFGFKWESRSPQPIQIIIHMAPEAAAPAAPRQLTPAPAPVRMTTITQTQQNTLGTFLIAPGITFSFNAAR
jgi:hypothetical protein